MFSTADDFWHQQSALLEFFWVFLQLLAGAPKISAKPSAAKNQIVESSKCFLTGICLPTHTFTPHPLSAELTGGCSLTPGFSPGGIHPCAHFVSTSELQICNVPAFPASYISWVTSAAIIPASPGTRAAVWLSGAEVV